MVSFGDCCVWPQQWSVHYCLYTQGVTAELSTPSLLLKQQRQKCELETTTTRAKTRTTEAQSVIRLNGPVKGDERIEVQVANTQTQMSHDTEESQKRLIVDMFGYTSMGKQLSFDWVATVTTDKLGEIAVKNFTSTTLDHTVIDTID